MGPAHRGKYHRRFFRPFLPHCGDSGGTESPEEGGDARDTPPPPHTGKPGRLETGSRLARCRCRERLCRIGEFRGSTAAPSRGGSGVTPVAAGNGGEAGPEPPGEGQGDFFFIIRFNLWRPCPDRTGIPKDEPPEKESGTGAAAAAALGAGQRPPRGSLFTNRCHRTGGQEIASLPGR